VPTPVPGGLELPGDVPPPALLPVLPTGARLLVGVLRLVTGPRGEGEPDAVPITWVVGRGWRALAVPWSVAGDTIHWPCFLHIPASSVARYVSKNVCMCLGACVWVRARCECEYQRRGGA